MNNNSPHYPIVNLSVDAFQARYYLGLPGYRQREILNGSRLFADALRLLNIPTICIAYDQDKTHKEEFRVDLAARACLDPDDFELFQRLTFSTCYFRTGDGLYIKQKTDALMDISDVGPMPSLLMERLSAFGTKRVILSGLETTVCLAATAWGAVNNDLPFMVACDLAGDTNYIHKEKDPRWHRDALRDALGKYAEGNLSTRTGILALISDGGCVRPSLSASRIAPSGLIL